MRFELAPLPYAKDALVPHLSAETLSFHYEKHHQTYLTNLKKLLEGKPEAEKPLDEIVRNSTGLVLNNAAQVWNHDFYWRSMKPNGGGEPSGPIADALKRDFGSYAEFRSQFSSAAVTHFGSGWTWLALDAGKLKVVSLHDADNPLKHGHKALLTCDVWEHAYYIDYRNARAKYVDAFLDHLINWDFATANLK